MSACLHNLLRCPYSITHLLAYLGTSAVPETDSYEGERDANDAMHGQGKMRFASGDVYVGQWLHGKMHGKGWYRRSDQTIYEGQWVDNLKHGELTVWCAPNEP